MVSNHQVSSISCQNDILLCSGKKEALLLKYFYSCKSLLNIRINSVWDFNFWDVLMRQTESHKDYLFRLYIHSILSQDWSSLCSRSFVFSEFLLKMSHGQVKVSVNKRNTSHFQQRASTRPLEPTVGEYSSLLT